ncbi:hypothetical protein HanHA89_Chr01g0018541 [Helianthus annuus]|nr:hypothetical protein HanHA89_Chr01g0018541 [Helianthus annuus]
MLAGKEADGVEVCGGGGEGYSWKNGWSDGGDAVVVGVGVKGTSVDDGGDGAGVGDYDDGVKIDWKKSERISMNVCVKTVGVMCV